VGKYIAQATGGELRLVEGAGHYPQTEVPDKAIPMILDFLGTAEGQSSRIKPPLVRQVSSA
jgi:hypothetical protein